MKKYVSRAMRLLTVKFLEQNDMDCVFVYPQIHILKLESPREPCFVLGSLLK